MVQNVFKAHYEYMIYLTYFKYKYLRTPGGYRGEGTWCGGVPGLGDVPGARGCTSSRGVGCTWFQGGTWSKGCTWSQREVYLVPGGLYLPEGVPAQGGVPIQGVPGLGVCTWSVGNFSWGHLFPGVYLVLGGVPGPKGWVYLVPEGVPGPGALPGLGKGEGVPAQELPPPPVDRQPV